MKLGIENLAISLGNRRVLEGVEAMFVPGRVVAVLGAGDAGPALLRALAGRLDADAGFVRLGGRLVGRFSRRERAGALMLVEARPGPRLFGKAPDLAAALAARPPWLLVEDPLGTRDPAAQLSLIARLRDAAAGGTGVVVALADPILAARAADDVLLVGGGRMLAFGPRGEVLSHPNLRAALGVEVMVIGDDAGRLLPVPIGRAQP